MGAAPDTLIATIDLSDPIDTARNMILRPAPGRAYALPGPGLGPIPHNLFPSKQGKAEIPRPDRVDSEAP